MVVILIILILALQPMSVTAQQPPCAIGESGPDCAPYRPALSPIETPAAPPAPTSTAAPQSAAPGPGPTPAQILYTRPTPAPVLLPATGAQDFILPLALFALAGLGLIAALRVLQGAWRVILLLLTVGCALGALWLVTH